MTQNADSGLGFMLMLTTVLRYTYSGQKHVHTHCTPQKTTTTKKNNNKRASTMTSTTDGASVVTDVERDQGNTG